VMVLLHLGIKHDSVLVPQAAVSSGPGQEYLVYWIQPDQTVVQRAVKIGQMENRRMEIIDGLSSGMMVAVGNIDRLRDGSRVKWTPWHESDEP